ncbi:MAG TPA: leucine-rich repeat domain-containing protein, partial [Verrucomicrobiae bacterium]|nr:leucine-rich repeat domain-containing protein [Verrucomicrobiae bacterium]
MKTLLGLAGCLLLAISASAQFSYATNATGVTITAYAGGGDVHVPATIDGLPVTEIGSMVFSGEGFTNVTIPGRVAVIDDSAFYESFDLRSITLSNGVGSLGANAFGSTLLTNVFIPASVTNIGEGIFWNCLALTNISVAPANASFSSLEGILFDKSMATLVQFPGGWSGAYAVPSFVSTIGKEAFGEGRIESVMIPGTVTNVDDYAFIVSSYLTNVTVAPGVARLGMGAFQSCLA